MFGSKRAHATDYTDSFGLAMAYAGDPLEVTQDGISFELLADYPIDVSFSGDSGCLVILDEKNLLLIGGAATSKAHIFNKDDGSWRAVSDMIEPRWDHNCGLVRGSSGSGYEVVVAGGSFNQILNNSTEIFSPDTETWRSGKKDIMI